MIRKLFLIIFLVLVFASSGWAADQNIYLDNGGAGAGSEADPYGAFSEINWTTGGANSIFDWVAANDDVYINLKKGVTWREQLTIGTSGVSGHPITIQPYDTGNAPIINGSEIVSTWTEYEETKTFTTLNDSGTGTERWYRVIVQSADGPTESGTFVRVQFLAHPTNETGILSASIGQRDAATDDMSAGPVRLTFDTGNNGTTISAGATKWSDWVSYTVDTGSKFDATANHLIHVHSDDEGDVSKLATYLNGVYFKTTTSDETMTATVTGTSTSANWFMVQAIGVRSNLKWEASLATAPNQMFFDGTQGTYQTSIANLDTDQEWYHTGTTAYQHSTSDPDTRYTSPGTEASNVSARGQGLIYVDGDDYITIEGLTLTQNSSHGVKATNGTDYLIVDTNTVTKNFDGGIVVSGVGTAPTNITIKYNTVQYNNYGQNNGPGDAPYHEGITVENVNTFTIEGNTVDNNQEEGIDAKYGSTAGTIQYNIVHDNAIQGAYLDGATSTTVKYNQFYDQTYDAALMLGCENNSFPTTGIDVFGNLFWGNNYALKFYNSGGITADFQNINIFNNTFYGNIGAAIYIHSNANDNFSGTHNAKNNIFWSVQSWYDAILDDSTGDDWITAATIDYNGFETGADTETTGTNSVVVASHGLTDPANDDFTLTSSSSWINAGVNLGASYDDGLDPDSTWPSSVATLDQDVWGAGWEIGAYVYEASEPGIVPFLRSPGFSGGIF